MNAVLAASLFFQILGFSFFAKADEGNCGGTGTYSSESFCSGLGEDQCDFFSQCRWTPPAGTACHATTSSYDYICNGLNENMCDIHDHCKWR